MHGGTHGHGGHVKWIAIILAHVAAIVLVVHLLGFGPKIHQAVFGHLPEHVAEKTTD